MTVEPPEVPLNFNQICLKTILYTQQLTIPRVETVDSLFEYNYQVHERVVAMIKAVQGFLDSYFGKK